MRTSKHCKAPQNHSKDEGGQQFFKKEKDDLFFSTGEKEAQTGRKIQTKQQTFFHPTTKPSVAVVASMPDPQKDSMPEMGHEALVKGQLVRNQPIFESAEDPPEDQLQTKGVASQEEGEGKTSMGLVDQLKATKGSGNQLPENTRFAMEASIGADFNAVRIHTDRQAVQMNQELGAQAFTHGADVYFNEGKYDTNSNSGQHLLAHELTHVVQQRGRKGSSGFVQAKRNRAQRTRIRNIRTALAQTPPDFSSRPDTTSGTTGGAFFLLDSLSSGDMMNTLKSLSVVERQLLLDNIGQASTFDQRRLELSLRAAQRIRIRRDAIRAIQFFDAIQTTTGTGSFRAAFRIIERLPGARRDAILNLFEAPALRQMLQHVGEANRGRREAVTGSLEQAINQNNVRRVQQALSQSPPDFVNSSNGAFAILNGLSATDLVGTLRSLTSQQRTLLLSNINLASSRFNQSRLEVALRGSMYERRQLVIDAVGISDAIGRAGTGSFATVFALFQARPRIELLDIFRLFNLATIRVLQANINDANSTQRTRLGLVFADMLGTPSMPASDLIDVSSIHGGYNKSMARIYNRYGQLLHHHAQAHNFHTDVLAGIFKVESSGRSFSAETDRPIIRFEAHLFWRRWGSLNAANRRLYRRHFQGHRSHRGHRFRMISGGRWISYHGNQTREQRALALATRLGGAELANSSVSFGLGQVVASRTNLRRLGFASAVDMANAFSSSERSQIQGMVDYLVNTRRLPRAIRRRNYFVIGERYNGNGARYGPRIRAAANAYRRVTRGRRFV